MKHIFHIMMIGTLLVGCQQEAYDSGDTSLSYLKAEMVNMRVEGVTLKSITNDEGKSLAFPPSLKLERPVARDTTLRWMMYYNMRRDGCIELVKAEQVYVLEPMAAHEEKEYRTDPVVLTSAWLSPNGKYVNLSLAVRTGVADDEKAHHTIGLVSDSVVVGQDFRRRSFVTLLHDQSGLPEFYTSTVYLSIPFDAYRSGEEINIDVNTYKGKVRRTFRKE